MASTPESKKFADRLSDLLDEARSKKEDYRTIAKALGISTGALSNYANDVQQANLTTVARIADYFHVSTDWLLGRTNDPSMNPCAVDELGLSAMACDKLHNLKNEHDLGVYSDCLSLFIEDADFTYFLALLSGITDSEGDKLITADSGKSRIRVRRIELTRFAIQNTAMDIANRMRDIFQSRYKTISQRQDERWIEIAWNRFNKGEISAQNRDELIAMVLEGGEETNGND